MGEMHDMYGHDDDGEYNPMDGDDDPGGRCFNCDEHFHADRPRLYCTPVCQAQADFVRYFRRCAADGRLVRPDVREAITIKRAHILAGGYDASSRTLTPALRAQIIERDGGVCCRCGESGTEIDHVSGGSNSLENLQLLCHDCHTEKTTSRIVPLTPDMHGYETSAALAASLDRRCKAQRAQRPCDDHVIWPGEQRRIMESLRQCWGE